MEKTISSNLSLKSFMTKFMVSFLVLGTMISLAVLVITVFNLFSVPENLIAKEQKSNNWYFWVLFFFLFISRYISATKSCWRAKHNNNFPKNYVKWSFVFLVTRYLLAFYLTIWIIISILSKELINAVWPKALALLFSIIVIKVNYNTGKEERLVEA